MMRFVVTIAAGAEEAAAAESHAASMLVSKGILVAVSGQQIMLPMDPIRSMVKVPAIPIRTVNGQPLAPGKGLVYPIISLAHSLAYPENEQPPTK